MTNQIRKCPAVILLTDAEHARLNNIPDATCEIETDLFCALEGHHPGDHVEFGQEADGVTWWVRWGDTTREIAQDATCADGDGNHLCGLPREHYGRHGYELSTLTTAAPTVG